MFTQLFVIFVLAVSSVLGQGSNVTIEAVVQAFTTAKIVPDVLPVFEPMGLLDVVFTDAMSASVNVTPGLNLSRDQTAFRPQVSFTTNTTTFVAQTFVLAMVDPDAPTPQNPNVSQIRHLLAPDLTLNGSAIGGAVLVNNTPAISDFLRPTPPAGSDPHRYTLLLFVQPAGFNQTAAGLVNSSTPVNHFNISEFAAQTGLGNPVAGTFFLTGPDANSTSTSSSTSDTAASASTSGTVPASSSSAQSAGSASGTPANNSALARGTGKMGLSLMGMAHALSVLVMFSL